MQDTPEVLPPPSEWSIRLDAGRAALQQRALDDAEVALEGALRIAEHEGDAAQLCTTLNLLARVHAMRGRPFVAAALLRRQLALEEQELGSDHLQLAATLANLGEMYAQLEAPRDELAVRQRALDLRRRLDPDPSAALLTRLEARIAQLHLRLAEDAGLDAATAEGRGRVITPAVVEGIPRESSASHAAWVAFLSGSAEPDEHDVPGARRRAPRRLVAAAIAAALLLAVTAWAVVARNDGGVAASRAGVLESGGTLAR